jgi:sarcosine oxidase
VRPDVIVVGLGSMGAAAVAELARRGVRVLGLDRFTPPHGRGEHAGGSRIIRLAYAEGEAYVPLLRRAYELWGALGGGLLTTTGGLNLGRPDSATVSGALESARTHGLAHELLDAAEVRRRFPAFQPPDDEVAVYEEVAGVVRPEAAIARWLGEAAADGAELRFAAPVTGWRASPGGDVTVDVGGAEVTAARLVLCPGPWAGELLGEAVTPVRVESRVQHYWAATPETDTRAVWIWEPGDAPVAYGIPAFDGVVKAAFHHVGAATDGERGAPDAAPAAVEAITAWLERRMPALARGRYLHAKPCLYTITPDEHFLLGPHPAAPSVSVAAGFSGHGFKFAPVIGEVLADLAQTGSTPHPIGPFAPDRLAGQATR